MRPLERLGVPPSTLVIGSMSPDLLFYVPIRMADPGTHTLAGAITIDLALGSAVFLIWRLAGRRFRAVFLPGLHLAPTPPQPKTPRLLPLPAAVLSGLFLGSLTHLGWDSFTHANGWAVNWLPWLSARYGPLPGYEWMQYLSGIAGLVAVVAWAAVRLRRGADTEVNGLTGAGGSPRGAGVRRPPSPAPRWVCGGVWTRSRTSCGERCS
jgi:hypothetical protein